jgi:hypothetical protein
VTDGKLASTLRSALRQIWSRTVKKQYLLSVRYRKDGRFHVRCAKCGKEMAIADKARPINKDGSVSRRKPQRLFDVDHIDGITPMGDPIKGLGAYWESMMTGPLQVLCKEKCHRAKTEREARARAEGRINAEDGDGK